MKRHVKGRGNPCSCDRATNIRLICVCTFPIFIHFHLLPPLPGASPTSGGSTRCTSKLIKAKQLRSISVLSSLQARLSFANLRQKCRLPVNVQTTSTRRRGGHCIYRIYVYSIALLKNYVGF